jgi:hypothetical protein
VEYTDGTERGARQAEEMMQRLAAHAGTRYDTQARARARTLTTRGHAGIRFDYSVRTHWQPIESQRALLWAGRFGKQEVSGYVCVLVARTCGVLARARAWYYCVGAFGLPQAA